MDLNRITLTGRLVADPEYKISQSGIAFCSIRVAVNRFAKTGEETKTDFFNCVAFNKTAEFISNYFTKGKKILIDGQMQNNDYIDKNGTKHYAMQIIIQSVYFCDSGQNSSTTAPTQPNNKAYQNSYQQQKNYYAQPKQRENNSAYGYGMPATPPIANSGLEDFEEIISNGNVPF